MKDFETIIGNSGMDIQEEASRNSCNPGGSEAVIVTG
jgi:hypothetical protein